MALDAALACPICLDELRSPVLLPCCGNTFCTNCLREAFQRSSTCPLCRSSTTWAAATPNRAISSLLPRGREPTRPGGSPRPSRPPSAPPRGGHAPWSPLLPMHTAPPPQLGAHGSYQQRLAAAEPRLRCAFYIVLVFTLMLFLRVEEEHYQSRALHHQERLIERLDAPHPHPDPEPSIRRPTRDVGGAIFMVVILVGMVNCLSRRRVCEVAEHFASKSSPKKVA
ncbi:hypothetical protein AB1Y20_023318 [Prymnesium parvum]|uniref:RING-type domain-containing protein n=1 Tax=Prymnesium parvum TaxID=97485 RepID=A0AB34JGG1_PRYPA